MRKVQIMSLALLGAAFCLMMAPIPTSAMNHIVGGSIGWTVPPNKTFYQHWAKPRVFGVGDSLLFPFTVLHNVMEVSPEDYNNCTQKKVINFYPKGPVLLNFTQPGDHYYYSAFGIQCEAGVKLHVTVVAGKGSSGRNSAGKSTGELTASPPLAPVPKAKGGRRLL